MERLPPIPSPPGAEFREFRIRFLPPIVFLLVLVAAGITWRHHVIPTGLVGEVEMVRSLVSSPVPGHLSELRVIPLQRVVAGQEIGRVLPTEPARAEAQAALSRARLDMLLAEMEPVMRRDNNEISYLRLQIEWLTHRVALASLHAQRRFFEAEQERIQALAPSDTNTLGVISIFDLQVAERDLADIDARMEEVSRLVTTTGEAVQRLRASQDDIDQRMPTALAAALTAEEQSLKAIEMQLQPLPLHAPIDGFVSLIHRRPGELLLAGDPIVTLSAHHSEHIIAFVRQPMGQIPDEGRAVLVRARSGQRASAVSEILAVGGQMEPIHPELMLTRPPSGQTLEYGLPLLIRNPVSLGLIPGELVDLQLLR
jgi:multidrug resistance efflux pump